MYAFKLASLNSLGVKILLNYQLKNEVSQANFNNYKRIYNWQPFMKRVYSSPIISGRLYIKYPRKKVHTFCKSKTLLNCMELLHLRLPTDEATKSIYDDIIIDTIDK